MTPTPPPAWAMKIAENAFAHPPPNNSIMQSVARAIAATAERVERETIGRCEEHYLPEGCVGKFAPCPTKYKEPENG